MQTYKEMLKEKIFLFLETLNASEAWEENVLVVQGFIDSLLVAVWVFL